jgi:hypothetical protein
MGPGLNSEIWATRSENFLGFRRVERFIWPGLSSWNIPAFLPLLTSL